MRDREKRRGYGERWEAERKGMKKRRAARRWWEVKKNGGVGLGPLGAWSMSLTNNNRGA